MLHVFIGCISPCNMILVESIFCLFLLSLDCSIYCQLVCMPGLLLVIVVVRAVRGMLPVWPGSERLEPETVLQCPGPVVTSDQYQLSSSSGYHHNTDSHLVTWSSPLIIITLIISIIISDDRVMWWQSVTCDHQAPESCRQYWPGCRQEQVEFNWNSSSIQLSDVVVCVGDVWEQDGWESGEWLQCGQLNVGGWVWVVTWPDQKMRDQSRAEQQCQLTSDMWPTFIIIFYFDTTHRVSHIKKTSSYYCQRTLFLTHPLLHIISREMRFPLEDIFLMEMKQK